MTKIKYLLITFFSLITFNTIVNILAREKQKIDFVKVAQININKEEVDIVQKRTHATITKIEKGEYHQFLKEGIENDIIHQITITDQKDIQKKIKNKLGSCIGLRFELLFVSKTDNPFKNKMYLFKGDFTSKKDVEIRIYLNNKNEIIDLNIFFWEKEYINYL